MQVLFVPRGSLAPPRAGVVTTEEFERARDIVVGACLLHGSVGPSTSSSSGPDDPDFYVVDDHYGDDRWITVEPKPEAISSRWIEELAHAISEASNWEVLLKPGEGIYVTVAPNVVKVVGSPVGPSNLSDFIPFVRKHLLHRQVRRLAAQTARLEEVRRRLLEAWPGAADGVELIAAFPTRSDGEDGDTVWLLHADARNALALRKTDFLPNALRFSTFIASRNGVVAEYSPAALTSDPGSALLVEWALVDGRLSLVGSKELRLRQGERNWRFSLASEVIH